MTTQFRNPILPGFHPDPSICRVGEDYYLVVSTFAYFPGIPIFQSRDLVHWKQIGHVIDRAEQIDYSGLGSNDGIWAPTIRHHQGTFYVVSTVARDRQGVLTFVATATDPAGPWSDPIPLDAPGIDPSLFFDDDGTCWFTAARDCRCGDSNPGEIWLRQLDLTTMTLVGETDILWHGAMRGAWIEAPHIYRREGKYYLLVAEGGAERNHSVTLAVADQVRGPYLPDPRNPLLTHRHRNPDYSVQNVGHADLVETPTGDWWAVTLAVRTVACTHVMGREVFLLPVQWTDCGPVFGSDGGGIPETGEVALVADEDPLAPYWMSLRGPIPGGQQQLSEQVTLLPRAEGLTGEGTPALLARRQEDEIFSWSAQVNPAEIPSGVAAGLVVFHHEDRWATVVVVDGQVQVTLRTGETEELVAAAPLPADTPLTLMVTGDGQRYHFHAGELLFSVARQVFSTEQAGGFVGTTLGVLAVGESTVPVTFTEITYRGQPWR